MQKTTHSLSGVVLAQSYFTWLGVPMDPGYLANPKVWLFAMPAMLACMFGAVFPDIDIRIKVFGHRTVTHWFPPFLLVAILAWFFFFPSVFLFCAAAMLHIFLDAFTKMGVPVLSPFGRRFGFRIFVTGGAGDVLMVMMLLCGSYGLWRLGA